MTFTIAPTAEAWPRSATTSTENLTGASTWPGLSPTTCGWPLSSSKPAANP
jgi:hypothetical protein